VFLMKNKISIEIVNAPGCSKCARAKEVIRNHIENMKGIDIKEINIAENPDIAVKYGIMSTPALIINGKLAFTSAPSEGELKKYIKKIEDAN